MAPKALVIDDDPQIRSVVGDILQSLRHDFDEADSVETARQLLDRGGYTYVLLDLEIPVKSGRQFPRIQDGENLLRQIVELRGTQRCPLVIVMTAHGTNGPELAVDMMKQGAFDYVTKPFKTVGRTLDKSIQEALASLGNEISRPPMAAPVGSVKESTGAATSPGFSGGELVFFDDHVELCGVDITSGSTSVQDRKALDVLRSLLKSGEFAPCRSKKLAACIGKPDKHSTMPGFVRELRRRIAKRMCDAKCQCGEDDVIRHVNGGYQLRDWLTVRDADEGHGALRGTVNGTVPVTVNGTVSGPVAARRQRLLTIVASGQKFRVPRLADELGYSERTVKRDLDALRDQIEFDGSPNSGYYRIRQVKNAR